MRKQQRTTSLQHTAAVPCRFPDRTSSPAQLVFVSIVVSIEYFVNGFGHVILCQYLVKFIVINLLVFQFMYSGLLSNIHSVYNLVFGF